MVAAAAALPASGVLGAPEASGACALPQRPLWLQVNLTCARISPAYHAVPPSLPCLAVTMFPIVLAILNWYWFIKIAKGAYKVLFGKPKAKAE